MYYFAPVSDMFETADYIAVYVELAGVGKEDINIEIDGGVLEVSGIKRRFGTNEECNFQRMERPFGLFRRRFSLPSSASYEGVKASFEEGLLEIIIPKKKRSGGFKISCIEIND